jgi:hypothetical protein
MVSAEPSGMARAEATKAAQAMAAAIDLTRRFRICFPFGSS